MRVIAGQIFEGRTIEHPESGRCILDPLADDQTVHRCEQGDAGTTHGRSAVGSALYVARPDRDVAGAARDALQKLVDLAGRMLSVAVHLNGQVVPATDGVHQARLNRCTDPDVEWQVEHRRPMLARHRSRSIGRSVVHYEDVCRGLMLAQRGDGSRDIRLFIESRNNDENALHCTTV